jgi:hypothetical protein
MPWSKKQKQIAGMACGQAGVDNDARKLILRQFRNAFFNVQGMPVSDPTSTSSKLENKDFERFMAILEDRAGGRVLNFSPNYWQEKAGSRSDNVNERMAWKARELYRTYESQQAGGLHGHGIYGLDGLVSRFSAHRTRVLEELTPKEAWNLVEMLKDLVSRRGEPATTKEEERQERLFSDRETPAFSTVSPAPAAPPRKRMARQPQKVLETEDIPF